MIARFIRQCLLICCAVLILGSWSDSVACAQSDARTLQNRTVRESRSTQQTNAAVMLREMQEARQNIPWSELSPAAQAKVRSVVSGNPLFHRMPQQTILADPEMYNFLLRHPDVVIGFWEHLGATQLMLREVRENHYVLTETGGTSAAVEVLYRSYDFCIIYARGEYRGPLLARAYQGDAILILRTQLARNDANEPLIVTDLDTFIQINSLGADMLVKLLFPSLTRVAESNFEVTMSFVEQVSRAAARNTAALKETAEEIATIRREVIDEFCEVADRVEMRFARRNRPLPLAIAQQSPPQFTAPLPVETPKVSVEYPKVEVPAENQHSFTITSRPPADWGMDHFFDTPLPLHTSVRQEGTSELNVPRPLGSTFFEYVVPKLPRKEQSNGIY